MMLMTATKITGDMITDHIGCNARRHILGSSALIRHNRTSILLIIASRWGIVPRIMILSKPGK